MSSGAPKPISTLPSPAKGVAYSRLPSRLGGEGRQNLCGRGSPLLSLSDPLSETESHINTRLPKDVVVRDASDDYSVPPGLTGRRMRIRPSLADRSIRLKGRETAHHMPHLIHMPDGVVIDSDHAGASLQSKQVHVCPRSGNVVLEVELDPL